MNSYQYIQSSSNDFQMEVSSFCFVTLQQIDYQYVFKTQNSTPFTGKELDSETGYSYFGARYYDADLSGLFFSVDPMADKYPNLSSYAYCAWNPIKLVDPTGDTIDVSGLSKDQLSVYNNSVNELNNSPLFEYYYGELQKSKKTYKVQAGSGQGGEGSFNPITNEISATLDNLYVLSQELFHAYQSDGNFYTSEDASVRETEGDLAAQLVMIEINRAFLSEEWSSKLMEFVDKNGNYEDIASPAFSVTFSQMVDLRIAFYSNRELQDKVHTPLTYVQTNSMKAPLALQKAVKERYKKY